MGVAIAEGTNVRLCLNPNPLPPPFLKPNGFATDEVAIKALKWDLSDKGKDNNADDVVAGGVVLLLDTSRYGVDDTPNTVEDDMSLV